MIIQKLTLNQFRCFSEKTFTFDARIVVIEGENGSGKSSILEALHYCCYLRSFRLGNNRDLMKLTTDHFFINVGFIQEAVGGDDTIQVGFSDADGKSVKYNQKRVQSYKELLEQYRIVTLASDDIELIQGAPEQRRDFLNYAILLATPGLLANFKRYKQILDQRNSFLRSNRSVLSEEFVIWTEKLWLESRSLAAYRVQYLQQLEKAVNILLTTHFSSENYQPSLMFQYQPKNMGDHENFASFWESYKHKYVQTELEWRRSLFGIHLDDFSIVFLDKKARIFASRGQQKLLTLLIKIAQLQQLSSAGEPGVLLLDDFMTDFDHDKVQRCIAALKELKFQIFISCPVSPKAFLSGLSPADVCHIKL